MKYYFEIGFPENFKISTIDRLVREVYGNCDAPEEWNELRENFVDTIGNDIYT